MLTKECLPAVRLQGYKSKPSRRRIALDDELGESVTQIANAIEHQNRVICGGIRHGYQSLGRRSPLLGALHKKSCLGLGHAPLSQGTAPLAYKQDFLCKASQQGRCRAFKLVTP
jgi:hypothetical protein